MLGSRSCVDPIRGFRTKPPLLVFPEGTCVNNEYVVMFKQGAFQLGKSVVPVAIKYNKVFVDAYWNSRTTSYPRHLFRLMTAWALVAEVSYLDPQYRLPGESAINFAARVKEMIAKEAGMGSVPWNGMLKYYKPRPEYKSNRQRIYAKMLKKRFGMEDSTSPAISPCVDMGFALWLTGMGAGRALLPCDVCRALFIARSTWMLINLHIAHFQGPASRG